MDFEQQHWCLFVLSSYLKVNVKRKFNDYINIYTFWVALNFIFLNSFIDQIQKYLMSELVRYSYKSVLGYRQQMFSDFR